VDLPLTPASERQPAACELLDMNSAAAHWGELSPRERKILLMDFYGGSRVPLDFPFLERGVM
jgi:hypothetical protein